MQSSFKIEFSRHTIPWLIQSKLISSRKFVRGKINQFVQNKHYGEKETQEATACSDGSLYSANLFRGIHGL